MSLSLEKSDLSTPWCRTGGIGLDTQLRFPLDPTSVLFRYAFVQDYVNFSVEATVS
jgi:hypothetical protein